MQFCCQNRYHSPAKWDNSTNDARTILWLNSLFGYRVSLTVILNSVVWIGQYNWYGILQRQNQLTPKCIPFIVACFCIITHLRTTLRELQSHNDRMRADDRAHVRLCQVIEKPALMNKNKTCINGFAYVEPDIYTLTCKSFESLGWPSDTKWPILF